MQVYILYGNDSFNMKHRLEEIKNEIDDEWLQFNYCSMPDDANPLSAINELLASSFGGGKKVVHVSNDCFFKDKQLALKALDKLELVSENNVLVITTSKKPVSNTIVVKKLIKYGQLEKYELIPEWKTSHISAYIKAEATSYGLDLQGECINYLVSNLGNNTQLINSELNKISIYSINSKISIEELRLLVKNSYSNSIELAKYCLYGNGKSAVEKLNQLQNIHPLQIVASLYTCFRNWFAVKAGAVEGLSNTKIASIACIYNPKRIYFLKQEVSDCSLTRLKGILSILTNLEYELKTGKNTLKSRIIEISQL